MSKKKDKKTRKAGKTGKAKPVAKANKAKVFDAVSAWLNNNKVALGIAAIAFLAHFIFSFMSNGFYQQDEVGHLNNMRSFWYNPNIILGNWPKAGYKLIYIIPSLLGNHAVTILNCFFAALAGFLSFKLAKQLGSKMAVLAAVLVATQPFFFEIAFRNYSEIVTSVILVGAVLSHYKARYHLATFLLAYVCIIRQEMFPLLAAYGIYLMINNRWISVLWGSLPVLALNLWGGIVKSDKFYILSSIIGTSDTYKKAYPRQGFWHYLSTSEVIFGAVVLVLIAAYFVTRRNNDSKNRFHNFLAIPAIYFFCFQTLVNIISWDIGPATGGNLRYLTTISPLLAVMGVLGLESFRNREKKLIPGVVMGLMALLIAYFLTYENNNIALLETRNWMPLIIAAGTLLIAYLSRKKFGDWIVFAALSGLALLNLSSSANTYKLTPEELAIEKAADWYTSQLKLDDARPNKIISAEDHIYFNHVVMTYFTEKCRPEFPGGGSGLLIEQLPDIPVGSIIFWDTHYSYRPKLRPTSVPEKYYLDRPQAFKKHKEWVSTDRRFKIVAFEKIGELSAEAKAPTNELSKKDFDGEIDDFRKMIEKDPNDDVAHFFLGKTLIANNKYNDGLASLTKSIALNDKNLEAFQERARTYLALGKYPEALGDANRVIILDSNDVNGYFMKGNALFQMNKFDDALQQFIRCNKLSPNNNSVIYQIGLCQLSLKDVTSACKNFDMAAKMGNEAAEKLIPQFCN